MLNISIIVFSRLLSINKKNQLTWSRKRSDFRAYKITVA